MKLWKEKYFKHFSRMFRIMRVCFIQQRLNLSQRDVTETRRQQQVCYDRFISLSVQYRSSVSAATIHEGFILFKPPNIFYGTF